MRFEEHYLNEESKVFYHGSPYSFTKFDMNKVGTGDGLNKYGFGLYFADNLELAEYYAHENYLRTKHQGMFLYEVKVNGIENFYQWDELIPEDIYLSIANKLEEEGFEEDANNMREELQSYGETYNLDQTYGILRDTLKSDKKASEFLYELNVYGSIVDDIQGRGKIYVAFSDSLIRILNVEELQGK